MVVTSSTAGRISAATGLNRVWKDAAAHVYFPEVAHAPPVQIVVQCSPYSHPSWISSGPRPNNGKIGPPRLPLIRIPARKNKKQTDRTLFFEYHYTGIERTVAPLLAQKTPRSAC